MSMEISAIRMVNIGKIKAVVDVRTSEGFIIRGFKVVEGDNGLFVGMPSERTKSGKYMDLVKIDDWNLKEMLETLVLDAYNKKKK
ncbi:MAG: septation protein SpoVG family protein [Calditrichia bacterium]